MKRLTDPLLETYMQEYKAQIQRGVITKAYRGLMEYLFQLKTHFEKKYPNYSASGNIYHGFMDMTYFAISPEPLERLKLKIAVVFVYEPFRFEVWLAGQNKQVQTKYWKLFKERGWNKCRVPSTVKSVDFILEQVIVESPNFSDLNELTAQIEKGTVEFAEEVCRFLS